MTSHFGAAFFKKWLDEEIEKTQHSLETTHLWEVDRDTYRLEVLEEVKTQFEILIGEGTMQ